MTPEDRRAPRIARGLHFRAYARALGVGLYDLKKWEDGGDVPDSARSVFDRQQRLHEAETSLVMSEWNYADITSRTYLTIQMPQTFVHRYPPVQTPFGGIGTVQAKPSRVYLVGVGLSSTGLFKLEQVSVNQRALPLAGPSEALTPTGVVQGFPFIWITPCAVWIGVSIQFEVTPATDRLIQVGVMGVFTEDKEWHE